MAQEREKTRIVLASILKPLDDTRMTEKIGASLASAGHDVTVVGYDSSAPLPDGMSFRPLGVFSRLSLQRWLARWRVFRLAFRSRPDVFIFSTYELLVPAIVLKVILGTRIIYDVRENYYRNILHSEGLSRLLRWPLAVAVRGMEKILAPMVDHFFLAEKGYDTEFRFHRGGWTVLENKAIGNSAGRSSNVRGLRLLFSGTLSESTGVFRAIYLTDRLHTLAPEVSLLIAGYAAAMSVQKRIREETEGKSYIRVLGLEALVPHAEIQSSIEQSDAGIIAYQNLPHTRNTVPTKLFEYLQASLPIITESHWHWVDRFTASSPFAFTDFAHPDADALINQLTTNTFYPSPALDTGWASEEAKLLQAIKTIV